MTKAENKNPVSIYLMKENVNSFEECISGSEFSRIVDKEELSQYKRLPQDESVAIYKKDVTSGNQLWLSNFFGNKDLKCISSTFRIIVIYKIDVGDNKHRFFVLPFGNVGNAINYDKIEHNFGIRCLFNQNKSGKIKEASLQQTCGYNLASHISVPTSSNIDNFGFDLQTNLVNEITSEITLDNIYTPEELAENKYSPKFMTRGKDYIKLSIYRDASSIKDALRKIYTIYNKKDYEEKFSWIDNILEVRSKTEVNELEDKLFYEIKHHKSGNTKLCFMLPIEYDFKYPVKLNYKTSSEKPYLCIDDFMYTYTIERDKLTKDNFVKTLKNHKVKMIIDKKYGEDVYNQQLVEFLNKTDKAYLFDRSTIGIKEHSSFEFCDVYYDNNLIHVKKGNSSSNLSHLFMQGYNSANLMKDYTILEKFKQKFENDERLDILDNYNSRTQTVVFAIIVDKDDNCKPHIPFFSKVTLWNACKELKKLGYKYAVKFIKNVGEKSNDKKN